MPWETPGPAGKPPDYFASLCREIISQQLGSGAARAIVARFSALMSRGRATPARVLALSEEELRAAGMSWAKTRSLRDLASRVEGGEIDFSKFAAADDEQVIVELVRVKGVGRWTAEMFLIFALGREDVFSFGDFALVKSLKALYGHRRTQTRTGMEKIVAAWSPYRSYASLALWHHADNNK
jgi:DNA-3-methyladenine glycosylase II